MEYLTLAELEAGLDAIHRSPTDDGTVALIVRRPAPDEREILKQATISTEEGLVGDRWSRGGSRDAVSGEVDRARQITLMNSRLAALIAQTPERWALAGDQLYVDLDIGTRNLPRGTRLAVGSAVIEASGEPHRGCTKFAGRFGMDALRFVNSPVGYALNLRGLNATVIEPGTVSVGDVIKKIN